MTLEHSQRFRCLHSEYLEGKLICQHQASRWKKQRITKTALLFAICFLLFLLCGTRNVRSSHGSPWLAVYTGDLNRPLSSLKGEEAETSLYSVPFQTQFLYLNCISLKLVLFQR